MSLNCNLLIPESSNNKDTEINPRCDTDWIVFEFGSVVLEKSGSCPFEILERMYRNVIMQSVRDIGCGSEHEQASVRRWMKTDSFLICCELAGWDNCWINELLSSVDAIDGCTRKPITKKCLEMIRALIRITSSKDSGSVDHLSSLLSTTSLDRPPADEYESNMDRYISKSKFSEMSRQKIEKKKTAQENLDSQLQ